MSIKPDVCIYHGNCADGFGAAWAVWKRWGAGVSFVPGFYGKEPPPVAGKSVLMVDFSFKRPALLSMAMSAREIVVLDHHKTAEEDLREFAARPFDSAGPDQEVAMGRKIAATFDMSKSGARLAWEYCFPNEPIPTLLAHVEDRDLWRFALPGTREIQAVVFSHPYDFDVWSTLVERAKHDPEGMVREGAAIERKHFKDIDELLTQTTRSMVIGGHRVPVANLPYTMASDAAGKLAEGQPFAACYFDRADARVFSLRSRGEGAADVSEIAARYGGGGHRNAAGFQAPLCWEGDEP